ncbi:MAG: hypothetical protein LBP74_00155 [Treponema sp.]|jgi:hypothetical protein|nr:hypothetical protein [Treponema sp.]
MYTDSINGKDAVRVIYNPNIIHCWAFTSPRVTRDFIDFFQKTIPAPNPIAPDNQVWQWKVLFETLGIIGFFMFLVYFILLLLETSFFSPLKAREPALPAEVNRKGKAWMWRGLSLSARPLLSHCLGNQSYQSTCLVQPVASLDVRVLVISHRFVYFKAVKLGEILKFAPFFVFFYLINSIAMNVFNYIKIGGRAWNTVLMCIFSALGPVILLVIFYTCFVITGLLPPDSLAWGAGTMIMWIYPMVVVLPVGTVISRVIYKKTRNPYIPGIAYSLIITVMLCTNTLTYLI